MASEAKPIEIIVDRNETNSGILKMLGKIPGVALVQEELQVGDYLVSKDCAIERKAVNDFVASILDKRLFSQANMLAANFSRPIIIVEGRFSDVVSAISKESLAGAISYLSLILEISVIYTESAKDTAVLVYTMARHLQHGLGYDVPLRANKPANIATLQQFLIEGLPGIGGTMARDILKQCGSPANALSMSKDEWSKIKGIGNGKMERIYEVIHSDCR